MFKIYDGRNHFYQWDINCKVIVNDTSIKEVHFSNGLSNTSLIVEVVNGIANVPNILLQDNMDIKVYGYDGEATKHCDVFEVVAKSKPADYVYTETEVKSWDECVSRIENTEE